MVLRNFTKLLTDFFVVVCFWLCAGLRAFERLGRLFEGQLLPGCLRLRGLAVIVFGNSRFFGHGGVSSGRMTYFEDLLVEARMIEERECRRQRFKIGGVWNFESPS